MERLSYRPSDLWDGTLDATKLIARRALERDEQTVRNAVTCMDCHQRLPRPDRMIAEYCCAIVQKSGYRASLGMFDSFGPASIGVDQVIGVKCSDCAGTHPNPWWWRD